jgi:hypothetical protein
MTFVLFSALNYATQLPSESDSGEQYKELHDDTRGQETMGNPTGLLVAKTLNETEVSTTKRDPQSKNRRM